MKSILKKLHIVSNESDEIKDDSLDGSVTSSKGGSGRSRTSSPARRSIQLLAEQKPLLGLSNWLSSVTSKRVSSSNSGNVEGTSSSFMEKEKEEDVVASYHYPGPGTDSEIVRSSEMAESCGVDVEAYQIQLALELSAKEDPEAVQIEAVKQISLGSCPLENKPAEVMAFRYWGQLDFI